MNANLYIACYVLNEMAESRHLANYPYRAVFTFASTLTIRYFDLFDIIRCFDATIEKSQ